MIVVKNLRLNERGETLFEKVSMVMQSGERIAMFGSSAHDVTMLLRIIAGESEMDEGTVSAEGERVVYVSPQQLAGLQQRPTFLILDMGVEKVEKEIIESVMRFLRSFKGGVLIFSRNVDLMNVAKITRVFELQSALKTVTSFTGTYESYLVEKEKNDTRANDAYKKQQREKRRLEEWLEQKRKEASIDRSPEKGATIRAKVKYLQREILSKEIPKPAGSEEEMI